MGDFPRELAAASSCCERHRVDDKKSVIRVYHVDHLDESISLTSPHDQPFTLAVLLWIGSAHNVLGFGGRDAMLGSFIAVPLNTAKIGGHKFNI
jgi:hypothetical protein